MRVSRLSIIVKFHIHYADMICSSCWIFTFTFILEICASEEIFFVRTKIKVPRQTIINRASIWICNIKRWCPIAIVQSCRSFIFRWISIWIVLCMIHKLFSLFCDIRYKKLWLLYHGCKTSEIQILVLVDYLDSSLLNLFLHLW